MSFMFSEHAKVYETCRIIAPAVCLQCYDLKDIEYKDMISGESHPLPLLLCNNPQSCFLAATL